MKLSEPKVVTFIIAIILALLAVLGMFISLPLISAHPFYVLSIAFILLVIGNLIKGI